MEIKKAKSLTEDILDLCSQFEDETLAEACSGIYNDIQMHKDVAHIVDSAGELMVFVNEASWDIIEYGEELKSEIERLYNQLLEEYNDF